MKLTSTDRPPFHHRVAACFAIAALAFAPVAQANPLGEAVRHGEVTFERIDGQLRVLQASDRAIIDWESFSIGAGELTEFLQPGSRSAALNRVRGASASTIEGALRANGRVYLINPNGILIGPGGTVDVGGFVASTLDVSDGEFLAGGDMVFAGASEAGIVNLGSISAFDGDVVLIAKTVENAGTIRAPGGTAALAAGNDVLLAESGAERVFVRGATGGAKAAGVTNTGNIEANIAELKAHGGNIYGMAVKNEGRVAATGVTKEGGQIFLRANGGPVRTTGTLKARNSKGGGGRILVDSGAEGKTEIGGRVDAKGETGTGGEIVILGREIDVMAGSLVIADGDSGGGTILIGGGVRGEDPAYHNAENVTVAEGATLSANAITNGNGGQIVVFAQDSLTFLGNLSATGGREGGNGGFAELSGKNSVTIPNLAGRIDLSALNGQGGTLLFDPIDTSVVGGTGGTIGGSPVSQNTLFADDIAAFLNSASLIVETDTIGGGNGDITIQNGVGISWNSAHSLTFNAFRDFNMTANSFVQSNGAGGVSVNAGRSIFLDVGSSISTTDGSIALNANTAGTAIGNVIGITLNDADLSTVDGNISLDGTGGIDSVTSNHHGVSILGGSVLSSSGTGDVTIIGVGGEGLHSNMGVNIEGSGTQISTQNGFISIVGTGAAAATGLSNDGVEIHNGAQVTATGGNLAITGQAGGGTSAMDGVALLNTGTLVKAEGGILTISGNGGAGNGVFGSLGARVEVSELDKIVIEGTGGESGITLMAGASVFADQGDIDLNGTATAFNNTGIVLNDADIQAEAGTVAGTIHFKAQGSGTGLAISSGNVANVLGGGTENVILESLGGDVTFTSAVTADWLQFRDSTGADNVNFSLTNTGSDVNWISGYGTGTLGAIGSLDYRDADGFRVGAFLGGDGIVSVGDVNLFSAGTGSDQILVTHQISSQGGAISLQGPIIKIDAAAVSNLGAGTVTFTADQSIAMINAASVSVVDGDLTMNANVGAPQIGDFRGIDLTGSSLLSSGAGNISLTGAGGDGSYLLAADGIRVHAGSTIFSTGTGTIGLLGTGGNGDQAAAGIVLYGSTTSIQSVTGSISLSGVGGTSPFGNGIGINMSGDSTIHSTGGAGNAATITIEGLGGQEGSGNIGVLMAGSSTGIHSAYGNISITGTGGGDGSGADNHGVYLENVSETIESTGTGLNAAQIKITGFGGDGSQNNDGIFIDGGVFISSVDGQIKLKGTGGTGAAGGNQGVYATSDFSISGSDQADVVIEGIGGSGADYNEGVKLSGSFAGVQTKNGKITINGTGGGNGTVGTGNRGVYVIGTQIQVTGAGDLEITGRGGQGDDEIDGIQLEFGTVVEVKDGAMTLDGAAGGTIGIGVNGTMDNGNIQSVGTGSVTIIGSGVGIILPPGVNLSNPNAVLGGSQAAFVTVTSNNGDLVLSGPTTADGAVDLKSSAQTILGGSVESINGSVFAKGNQVFVNAPLTANNGNLTVEIDDIDVEIPVSGTIHVNNQLSAAGFTFNGGYGDADTVTYAGFNGGPIVFNFDDLNGIEFLVGPSPTGDELVGPGRGGEFTFTGPDAFTVNGVSVTEFENVTGGADDDKFSFAAGSSLSGHLDGGGGANELNYANFGTAVIVNLDTEVATAISNGFSNIQNFTGSPNIDTVTGPGSSSIYNIYGPDSVEVGGIHVTGFENLIGGPNDDQFVFLSEGSLTGYLDGGLATGQNTLDYSSFGAPVSINLGTLPNASATAIGGGFLRVTDFIGSAGLTDSFTGPNVGLTYNLSAPNTFNTLTFGATDFENLTGGTAADTFMVAPGASLTGQLAGGGATDTLNYSAFGGPVTVNIGTSQATGFGSIATLENFIGSGAADTFATNGSNDVFNITTNNGGNVNGATTFTSFENLNAGVGNDRFNFLNQATVALVDGGPGTDTLFLNDSNLGGNNTYTITANNISRNPTYNFTGMEIVQLLLGPGNDTVNSGFFGFSQIIDGGNGNDTLNLPGVLSLDSGNPIQNVFHLGFEAPRDNAAIDLGDILQIQLDQQIGLLDNLGQDGFLTENQFNNPANSPGLMGQLAGLGGAFAAATALTGQAVVISVEGNAYLVLIPFSLDGSGLTPSNLALAALAESLGVDANLELAQAIGYTGAIYLVMLDGAYALDLSGVPVDPSVLAALQEALSIAAARELFNALGMPLAVFVTGADGALSIDLDGVAPGQPVVVVLTEQLSDAALAELNAALGN
jgi:filamentous hemagglutinin family protein